MTGIRAALEFLAGARREDSLRRPLQDLGLEVTIRDLVVLARASGFEITSDDLEQAYVIDWRLRRAYYFRNH